MNNHFVFVAGGESCTHVPHGAEEDNRDSQFYFRPVTEGYVLRLLSSLDVKKASGPG